MFEIDETTAGMISKNDLYNIESIINRSIELAHEWYKNELLKKGNLKLKNNIARFGLPEVVTCQCNKACKGCYACKQLFNNVRESRLKNLLLVQEALKDKNFKQDFIKKMSYELGLHGYICQYMNKKAIMRWHDSGDIISIEHLKLIIEIVLQNKNIKFYTYTKNQKAFEYYKNLKDMGVLDNFNIVNSYIYGHVNYFDLNSKQNGHAEYIQLRRILKRARRDGLKIFMCDYGFDKFKKSNKYRYNQLLHLIKKFQDVVKLNNGMACGDCSACCEYEHVIFLKH